MYKGPAVIDLLTGSNALLDARLLATSVTQTDSTKPTVELHFRVRHGSDFSEVRIIFTDVMAYEISYEEVENYLDVWDLKFLQLGDGSFYITLDPDPSTLPAAGVTNVRASDTDRFYVRARHIEAFVTKSDSGTSS